MRFHLSLGILVLLSTVSVSAYDGPHVVDDANFLTGKQLLELELIAQQASEQLGLEIVLLTTPSIAGQKIELYSRAIYKVWKIRGEESDNGLLIVVVKDQSLVYFEMGKDVDRAGIENRLSDIRDQILIPRLKSDQGAEGLRLALEAIMTEPETSTDYWVYLWLLPAGLVLLIIHANTWNRKLRKCPECGMKIRPSVSRCPGCLATVRSGPLDGCPCGSGNSYTSCCLETHLDGRESLRLQFLRILDIRYLMQLTTGFGGFTAGGPGRLPGHHEGGKPADVQATIGRW
jgi:hypothetical protein